MTRTTVALLTLTLTAGAFAAVRPVLFQEPQMPDVTEQHKLVQAGVGEWEGTLTMFMPDMEPTPMTAKESVTAVGDYWTTSRFEADMGGMPFFGASTLGYDSDKKQFVGTWIDSTTTYMTVMHGEFNKEKNTLVMHWEGPNWMGDGALIPFRMESVHRADVAVTNFFMGEGQTTRHMEIKMKRKAAAGSAK